MLLCVSVYLCLEVTCLERSDLLALVCGVWLWVCHFPMGILGQLWYLIVLIPDLHTLTFTVFQLTSLVTAFVCHISSCIDNPKILQQLATLGVVAQFEGLLSCHGDEITMLEDMIVAVDDLATVSFTFFAETPQNKEINMTTTR